MLELDVRVRARQQEADGICSYELEPMGATELPAFSAGAHIDVQVAPGLIRQYSLCGHPQERRSWRIGVLREPQSRGGSAGMHDQVQVGTVLKVSAPKNLFELVPAPHSVLVAGGIGVTPILAMAQHLHGQGQPFELHYCARSPERMAFRDELAASAWATQARLSFNEGGTPAQTFDVQAMLGAAPAGAHLYICGPAGFMDFVLSAARAAGWPEARLHREHFAAVAADTTGDQPFQIRLQRSGTTLGVPVEKSVLQVLLDHGVEMDYSCEAGVCGSCVTRVLEGTPDHRDAFLMEAERAANDQFTPCCSRSKSPTLVLDL